MGTEPREEAWSSALPLVPRILVAVLGVVTCIALVGTYVLLDQAGDEAGNLVARLLRWVEQAAVVALLAIMLVRNLVGPGLPYVANLTAGGAVALAVVRGMRSHEADVVESFGGDGLGYLMVTAQVAAVVGAGLIVLVTLLTAAIREDQEAHLPSRQHLETMSAFHVLFLVLAVRWLVLDPARVNNSDTSVFRTEPGSWALVGVVILVAVVTYLGYRTYARGGSRAVLVLGHLATVSLGVFVVVYTRAEIDHFAVQEGFQTGVWEIQQAVSTWAAIGISIGALMVVAVAPVLERALAPTPEDQLPVA